MSLSRSLRSFGELVVIVATALFFALAIQAYAVKPYVIPTPSMAPTLEVGQRVLVDRFSHRIGARPQAQRQGDNRGNSDDSRYRARCRAARSSAARSRRSGRLGASAARSGRASPQPYKQKAVSSRATPTGSS